MYTNHRNCWSLTQRLGYVLACPAPPARRLGASASHQSFQILAHLFERWERCKIRGYSCNVSTETNDLSPTQELGNQIVLRFWIARVSSVAFFKLINRIILFGTIPAGILKQKFGLSHFLENHWMRSKHHLTFSHKVQRTRIQHCSQFHKDACLSRYHGNDRSWLDW